MNYTEIETKVKEITVEKLGVEDDRLKSDTRFIDDLSADSLDMVELVMKFEDEFNIRIPDDDVEKNKLSTIGKAVEYINKKLNNKVY